MYFDHPSVLPEGYNPPDPESSDDDDASDEDEVMMDVDIAQPPAAATTGELSFTDEMLNQAQEAEPLIAAQWENGGAFPLLDGTAHSPLTRTLRATWEPPVGSSQYPRKR